MKNKLSTKELFDKIKEGLVLDLEENQIPCTKCGGVQKIMTERNGKHYISNCRTCYTGVLYVCEYCGDAYKSTCNCVESRKARDEERRLLQHEKTVKALEKAERIQYEDYDGVFLAHGGNRVQGKDEFGDWIYDLIYSNEDIPSPIWAVEPTVVFNIDIRDTIECECENGYEDMEDNLDMKSELLDQANELINKWQEEQGSALNVYYETTKKVVVIDELVEEIKHDIAVKKGDTL